MKLFAWSGILAFVFYFCGVVIGGAMIPGYSHLNQAISEIDPLLTKDLRFITLFFFGVYNLLVLLYGAAIFVYNKKNIPVKIQSVSLFFAGLSGLLMFVFPMDVAGKAMTTGGFIHILLAGIIAPLTILITVIGFWAFRENKAVRIYSLVTGVVVLVAGGLTAYSFANGAAHGAGLLERITIGSFITWLLVTGIGYARGAAGFKA